MISVLKTIEQKAFSKRSINFQKTITFSNLIFEVNTFPMFRFYVGKINVKWSLSKRSEILLHNFTDTRCSSLWR